MEHSLLSLSRGLANAVAGAAASVVAVHGHPRMPASGLLWRNGVVITAEHLVRQDEDLTVTLPDNRTVPAQLAGRDPGTDLAVLRVPDVVAPESGPADPDLPAVGGLVLAVGRTEAHGPQASLGVVSTRGGPFRTWRGGMVDQLVRLDVTLYPGLSGGALADASGRVVGLVTAGLSRTAGLCIPLSTVRRIADELLARGRVARGYLGVGLQPVPLPAPLRPAGQPDQASGLMVLSVEPESPAGHAGLLLGDLLVALNSRPVQDTDDVQAVLGSVPIGQNVALSVVRGGQPAELSAVVAERPRKG